MAVLQELADMAAFDDVALDGLLVRDNGFPRDARLDYVKMRDLSGCDHQLNVWTWYRQPRAPATTHNNPHAICE